MNIAVIGTGYVGLVTGTCFAETGNNVICVDIDGQKVEKMRAGFVPIFEPGLNILFERNTQKGRLTFTTNLEKAIKNAQIIFLALPTPPGADGAADLSFVLGVARQLSGLITDYKVVVNKSTVPVGTGEKVHKALATSLDESLFDVVSNPEFLREGVAVDDFMRPDRVVVGTDSEKAEKIMTQLYRPFVRQGNPIYIMDIRSAEMTKYAANAYLATRITFMNEIANLCERVGADVEKVRMGVGSDNRIGKRFLFPGIGFGGSCFPKDVQALHRTARKNAYDFKILDAVLDVNNRQRVVLFDKIRDFFGGDLKNKKIALWGLAFKPNTDDIREAPSLYIIDKLLKAGADIHVYDPEAMESVQAIYKDRVTFGGDQYEILKDADALAIITEWSVFRTPDFEKMQKNLGQTNIFDGRNLYSLEAMSHLPFYYASIGRQVILPKGT